MLPLAVREFIELTAFLLFMCKKQMYEKYYFE